MCRILNGRCPACRGSSSGGAELRGWQMTGTTGCSMGEEEEEGEATAPYTALGSAHSAGTAGHRP